MPSSSAEGSLFRRSNGGLLLASSVVRCTAAQDHQRNDDEGGHAQGHRSYDQGFVEQTGRPVLVVRLTRSVPLGDLRLAGGQRRGRRGESRCRGCSSGYASTSKSHAFAATLAVALHGSSAESASSDRRLR